MADEFGEGVPDEVPVDAPVEEAVEAESPEVPEESPVETPPRVVIEALKSEGFQFDDTYDDRRFLDELVPEMETYLNERQAFLDWKSGKQPEAAKKQEPVAEKPQKAPRPQISETCQRMIDGGLVAVDPKTGLFASEDPRLDAYVREANEATQWQRKRAQRLVEDPVAAIREEGLDDLLKSMRDELRQEIRDEFVREMAAQRQTSNLEKFWETNGGQFYQKDAKGNVLMGAGGRPLLNARGQAFTAAQKKAREYGITDPERVHQFALDQVASFKEPKPKGQTVDEKVRSIRSTNRLNGSHSVASAIKKQDAELDIGELWDQVAHEYR